MLQAVHAPEYLVPENSKIERLFDGAVRQNNFGMHLQIYNHESQMALLNEHVGETGRRQLCVSVYVGELFNNREIMLSANVFSNKTSFEKVISGSIFSSRWALTREYFSDTRLSFSKAVGESLAYSG